MEEEKDDNVNLPNEEDNTDDNDSSNLGNVINVSGMYNEWFLDYASYVILERAVPHINDGLKPVQRRILHSLKEMDDGRYHKVANVIGNTMKFHPHGDASIGDAMVQIGQKDLLLDCQGNWGNILTGDRAAAPRYIEVRLSKFALDVAFNAKTTEWAASYDSRGKEPVTLPVKFPLLLAQGVEGIAVGLACKMLPHNFIELIDSSIAILRNKPFTLVPDFITGGTADFSNYNDGIRGGKVRVRAKINQLDKKMLVISEIPFGTNTSSLIDSIIKANDKGKIKVKSIEDNTSENVEIIIHLPPGVSPDKMIDALYAFTDCEVSISPNSGVIEDNKPKFLGVTEILRNSTYQTKDLLQMELEIRKGELQEQWHFSSLEKIFIENRIYRDIEEQETLEGIFKAVYDGLAPFTKHLLREVTDDDVNRLLEIRIKRISKFDSFKADELIKRIEDEIEEINHHLDNLVDYTIAYFKRIKEKYGKGRERKTEIKSFETIDATKVAVANAKLYVQRQEGFIGHGLRKGDAEFVADCSDIDDIIIFREDGIMMVSKISPKTFVGKNIIHVDVWKKGDKRTIYNLIYQDGPTGASMMKRFAVTSITRDKEYDLTAGTPKSKITYFSANPNGEAEVVNITLRPRPKLKKLKFDLDFSELAIKGRSAKGNTVTKNLIAKIKLKEEGVSTLGARKVWFDDTVQRLNTEGRGELLGEFKAEDKILTVMQSGQLRLTSFNVSNHFDDDLILIEKWNPKRPLAAVYYDGEKGDYYVKRFLVEDSDKKQFFITEHKDSRLEIISAAKLPAIELVFRKERDKDQRENELINLNEFISVKGFKALGNKLTAYTINSVDIVPEDEAKERLGIEDEVEEESIEELPEDKETESATDNDDSDTGSDDEPEDISEQSIKKEADLKKPTDEETASNRPPKKGPITDADSDKDNQISLF